MLSACAIGSPETEGPKTPGQVAPPKPVPGNFCAIYSPVYTSRSDTEETKKQVDKNNAVWLEVCEKNAS